jgi:hypothetical protein
MFKFNVSVWNHGTADNATVPCGEVDIINVSGERLPTPVLRRLKMVSFV